jgi:alcohol dehydrogenase class IV
MLRPVLQHNSEAARELYAELAEIVDPDCAQQGSQARCARLIERLDQLSKASGLQLRLRDHRIPYDDIAMLASEAMKQQRLLVNNPCPITQSDAQRLYEVAW